MVKTPRPSEPPPDTSVGLKAVELGLITEPQLTELIRDLARQPSPLPLTDALVTRGLLTPVQLKGLLSGGPGTAAPQIGKYRLLRELGRGGMGVVHEAEDVDLKRRCALKTMIEREFADPKERAQEEELFIREARLCANLPKHPSIVGVYEAGVVDGRRILAMELVDGAQLQNWRRKEAPSLRAQVQVIREVAEAVAHAHRHGVVHRDLKPTNILVDGTRRPHVTDFGLAKRARETTLFSLTSSGTVVGTPSYMSPEQAEGKVEVGPATDQWALGVMLYEILAGRLPFRGDSALEIMTKAVNEPIQPPNQLIRDPAKKIDERLERVCLRALKKDPAQRFSDVQVFADNLGAWLKGGPVSKVTRKPSRRPAIIAAAVAGGLALLVLLLVLPRRPAPDPAALRREAVEGFVADGRRQLAQKNYPDALIAFGRALAEEPGHAAAAKGKLEAERRLRAPTLEAEAADFAAAFRKLLDEGKIPEAIARLEEAEGRRLPGPWPGVLAELRTSLKKKLDGLFPGLRDRAIQAKLRQSGAELERLTREVAAWKSPELAAALKNALDRAESPAPPAPSAERAPGLKESHQLKGHQNGVSTLAFSPDGSRLLSGSFDKTAKLWDLSASSGPLQDYPFAERSTAAAFSPDGRWFAVGVGDGIVRLHDAKTLKARMLGGHTAQITGIVFSPDSLRLYSCSTDGTIRAWSTADGATQRLFEGHSLGAMSVACAPDGATVAGGTAGGEIKLWEALTGRHLKSLRSPEPGGGILSLAFSPDGAVLASAANDGPIVLWNPAGGEARRFARHAPKLRQLAWSPDGRWIATAAGDGSLRIWDAAAGALKTQLPCEGGWFSVAFSPDGRRLAGGTYDWLIRIYDLGSLAGPSLKPR